MGRPRLLLRLTREDPEEGDDETDDEELLAVLVRLAAAARPDHPRVEAARGRVRAVGRDLEGLRRRVVGRIDLIADRSADRFEGMGVHGYLLAGERDRLDPRRLTHREGLAPVCALVDRHAALEIGQVE